MGRPRFDPRSGQLGRRRPHALDGTERSIATALTGDRSDMGVRTGAFSAMALGRLDPIETIAAGAALERHTTWVNGEAGLDGLTDEVFQIINQPVVRTSDRWRALRAAMRQLQIVAETQLINDTIPQPAGSKVWPERWAELRGRYVATIRKPIWRHWRENIVDASFFGNRISKSDAGQGPPARSPRRCGWSRRRRCVSAASPMTELHAAQGTKATTGGITRTDRAGHGVPVRACVTPRLDAQRRAPFHGTGRALDFRASANPATGGEAHQLISILGGGELENTVDRGKLAAWATEPRAADGSAQGPGGRRRPARPTRWNSPAWCRPRSTAIPPGSTGGPGAPGADRTPQSGPGDVRQDRNADRGGLPGRVVRDHRQLTDERPKAVTLLERVVAAQTAAEARWR